MKINLISIEEHAELLDIFNNYPALTLQNNGYEYIRKSELSEEDKNKLDRVSEILRKAVVGFSEFSNFRRHKKSGKVEIRLQYDWTAHDRSLGIPFTGAGYILLDELLNGFETED